MEYSVYVDRHRHTYLQYKDEGRTRYYVSMTNGQIETIQLGSRDFEELIPHSICTPEHFAEVYLKSTQDISPSARAILCGVLGVSAAEMRGAESPRFISGSVTIGEICKENHWEPSKVRKQLRKLMKKPSGRWSWSPEEAQNIVRMLKECLLQETTS